LLIVLLLVLCFAPVPIVLLLAQLDLQIATRLLLGLVAIVPFVRPLVRALFGLQTLLTAVAAHI
jgi:hypothetical protein